MVVYYTITNVWCIIMQKISGYKYLEVKIKETQQEFFNMSATERIKFIGSFESMQPYQKVALHGCKAIMSKMELKEYNKAVREQKQHREQLTRQPGIE